MPAIDLLEDRCVPASFNVVNTSNAGLGSLRQAILNANASPGADIITFQAGLSGTITLTSSQQLLVTDSVDIRGPGASILAVSGNNSTRVFDLFDPSKNANIRIAGLKITGGNSGAFDGGGIRNNGEDLVLDGVNITVNRATLGGGLFASGAAVDLTIKNSTISGNSNESGGGGGGGGIYIRDTGGPLLIQNSTISGNSSQYSSGGGIYIRNTGGPLLIQNSTISGNSSNGSGGGIALFSTRADVTIAACTISGNTASGFGGGIQVVQPRAGTVTIRNTTISGNEGADGGGIRLESGEDGLSLVIENSTISGNQATAGVGGGVGFSTLYYYGALSDVKIRNSTIANNTAGRGGGIFVNDGTLYNGDVGLSLAIENCTISGNQATAGDGGGVYLIADYYYGYLSDVKIRNSTIANNTATGRGGGIFVDSVTLSLTSSIVAKNTVGMGTPSDLDGVEGTFNASFDLIHALGDGANINDLGNNIFGQDPLLGPLQNNGGPTKTHALLAGSPAINKGDNPAQLATDQRGAGFLRTFGGKTDIGAFEVQPTSVQLAATKVKLLYPLQFFSLGSGLVQGIFTLVNISGAPIAGPIRLSFPKLPPGVSVKSATIIASLAKGQAARIVVVFNNPLNAYLGNLHFKFPADVLAG